MLYMCHWYLADDSQLEWLYLLFILWEEFWKSNMGPRACYTGTLPPSQIPSTQLHVLTITNKVAIYQDPWTCFCVNITNSIDSHGLWHLKKSQSYLTLVHRTPKITLCPHPPPTVYLWTQMLQQFWSYRPSSSRPGTLLPQCLCPLP